MGSHGHRRERPLPLLPPVTDRSIKRFPLPRLLLPRLSSLQRLHLSWSPNYLTTSLTLPDASRRSRPPVSPPFVPPPCTLPRARDCRASTTGLSHFQPRSRIAVPLPVPIGCPEHLRDNGREFDLYFVLFPCHVWSVLAKLARRRWEAGSVGSNGSDQVYKSCTLQFFLSPRLDSNLNESIWQFGSVRWGKVARSRRLPIVSYVHRLHAQIICHTTASQPTLWSVLPHGFHRDFLALSELTVLFVSRFLIAMEVLMQRTTS